MLESIDSDRLAFMALEAVSSSKGSDKAALDIARDSSLDGSERKAISIMRYQLCKTFLAAHGRFLFFTSFHSVSSSGSAENSMVEKLLVS